MPLSLPPGTGAPTQPTRELSVSLFYTAKVEEPDLTGQKAWYLEILIIASFICLLIWGVFRDSILI